MNGEKEDPKRIPIEEISHPDAPHPDPKTITAVKKILRKVGITPMEAEVNLADTPDILTFSDLYELIAAEEEILIKREAEWELSPQYKRGMAAYKEAQSYFINQSKRVYKKNRKKSVDISVLHDEDDNLKVSKGRTEEAYVYHFNEGMMQVSYRELHPFQREIEEISEAKNFLREMIAGNNIKGDERRKDLINYLAKKSGQCLVGSFKAEKNAGSLLYQTWIIIFDEYLKRIPGGEQPSED